MKNRLSKLKSGAFSRGLALAKLSASVGAKAASHALNGLLSTQARERGLAELLRSQAELLARELGQLKGTLMKVGQMISVVGEHWLPPEAIEALKSLQSQSPPLAWEPIRKVLNSELGDERLRLLEVDPEPAAAASLGQVHRAERLSDRRELALKIQYPGVDRAIDSDLRVMRQILSVSKLLPAERNFDPVFEEVREMLKREVDYRLELEQTREFREKLRGDPRYLVPEVFPEFSTGRVLASSYEPGLEVDSSEVLSLAQERRDRLGTAYLELYFREIFEWRMVQTDPHFGNYRIRPSRAGDALVLYDFGAIRVISDQFYKPYIRMIRGGFALDGDEVLAGAAEFGFLSLDEPRERLDQFVELCLLIMEPFCEPGRTERPGLFDPEGRYDWGASDLPKRVVRAGKDLALAFRLRPPPREVVFLDRKMAGVFAFLHRLKVRIRAREMLEEKLGQKTPEV